MGNNYTGYEAALQETGFMKLSTRREDLCLKFAIKSVQNSNFKSWFEEDKTVNVTRRVKKNLKEARTRRFRKSVIPYLTHILNKRGYTDSENQT